MGVIHGCDMAGKKLKDVRQFYGLQNCFGVKKIICPVNITLFVPTDHL